MCVNEIRRTAGRAFSASRSGTRETQSSDDGSSIYGQATTRMLFLQRQSVWNLKFRPPSVSGIVINPPCSRSRILLFHKDALVKCVANLLYELPQAERRRLHRKRPANCDYLKDLNNDPGDQHQQESPTGVVVKRNLFQLEQASVPMIAGRMA